MALERIDSWVDDGIQLTVTEHRLGNCSHGVVLWRSDITQQKMDSNESSNQQAVSNSK